MGRWSRLAGEKFLDWLDPPKNLSWIDVGCGNGAFTEVLIARCSPAAVTGVDPSDGQLAFARTRPGAKMAQFRVADAQILPFADNSFDAASMALVITFIPDPVKAAKEMARVVKPGGWVATYMWDFAGGGLPTPADLGGGESLGMSDRCGRTSMHSRHDDMRAIWQQAGLHVARHAGDPHPGRLFQLRRFLGLRTACRSARPAKRSRTCRRTCGKSSRQRLREQFCPSPPTGASPTKPSPMP